MTGYLYIQHSIAEHHLLDFSHITNGLASSGDLQGLGVEPD